MSAMMMKKLELIKKLRDMNLGIHTCADHIRCSMLRITNEFLDDVWVEQGNEQKLQQTIGKLGTKKRKD